MPGFNASAPTTYGVNYLPRSESLLGKYTNSLNSCISFHCVKFNHRVLKSMRSEMENQRVGLLTTMKKLAYYL